MKKVGIIGLWHLGCVLSAAWSELGHKVIGYDPDVERVEKLKKGEPPLFEPGLPESITGSMDRGLLDFSNDIFSLSDCDFIFLSYDTPVLDDDSSDTTILTDSVRNVSSVMKKGAVLIVSSQSPAGFCRKLRELLKDADESLDIAYSPENLRLGEAINCYLNPGRIILGTADAQTEEKCRELFSSINADLLAMGLESSEMVKHGINAFLSNSIVFANHLADICETTGARIDDVVHGMKSDPRIGSKAYLAPGIGFSGGTLGRDLKVLGGLNNAAGGSADLFEQIHVYNSTRKQVIVARIEKILGGLDGTTIAVLGVTYKPGTSTLRRSLPLEIVDILLEKGCDVKVYDPKADYSELSEEPRFNIATDIAEVLESVDIAVLLTDWPAFKNYNWAGAAGTMKRALFYDTRNCLSEDVMKEQGFEFYSTGRS